jgi:hypothetical protein
MSRNDSWHRKISTGHHFQNGHHNTAQYQHCSISTTFHMWVDYDVPKWFRTMLNLCGIVVAILKMATGRNFSMSGIISGHHNLPTYEMANGRHNTAQIQHCSISTSWIDSRHWKIYTGLYFQNGRHNTAKIQHCSISKVAFNLFFKPVVGGCFGRLHNH